MGEQTTPLQQPAKASKIVDDGPLKVTDIEATTVKTDNLEANAGTEISVNDDIQVGNLDATDIDTTDIQSTNQPQPWGMPASNSTTGTVPCGSWVIDTSHTLYPGFTARRAGVYNFRTKNGTGASFLDESAHSVKIYVNSTSSDLEGAAVGGYGTDHDITLAVGDVVFFLKNTIVGIVGVEARNADGWM